MTRGSFNSDVVAAVNDEPAFNELLTRIGGFLLGIACNRGEDEEADENLRLSVR